MKLVFLACVLAFTAVAAVHDFRTKRLPNVLTVPALVAGLVFAIVRGSVESGAAGAWERLLDSLGGFAVGFGIMWVLWMVGGGLGGDVKFVGAVGAWLGTWNTLMVLAVASGLALVATFFMAALTMLGMGSGAQRGKGVQLKDVKRGVVPFGVPVAVATWCVVGYDLFLAKLVQ